MLIPYKILKLEKRHYPVCPECGHHSIVLFTPPKEGIVGTDEGYRTLGTPEYIDWDKAHLYCCNDANCSFKTPLRQLTTPLRESNN